MTGDCFAAKTKSAARNDMPYCIFEACFEAWGWLIYKHRFHQKLKRMFPMKNQIALFVHNTAKINRQHIQLALTLIALVMLVLGVGAPTEAGGTGPR